MSSKTSLEFKFAYSESSSSPFVDLASEQEHRQKNDSCNYVEQYSRNCGVLASLFDGLQACPVLTRHWCTQLCGCKRTETKRHLTGASKVF